MPNNGKIIRNGAEIQIDENGGIIARPADGQKLIVEDDAAVGALEAESLKNKRTNEILFDEGTVWSPAGHMTLDSDPDNTTSTEFFEIANVNGLVSHPTNPEIPEGVTLFGHFAGKASVDTEGESATVSLFTNGFPSRSFNYLEELELVFDDTEPQEVSSGWVEMTSISESSDWIVFDRMDAKVTDGEFIPERGRDWSASFVWVVN